MKSLIKKIFVSIVILFWIFVSNSYAVSWDVNMWSTEFKVPVWQLLPWWSHLKNTQSWRTLSEDVNFALWVVIQKLMIVLWSVAFLVMVIWAAQMTFAAWADDKIKLWKAMFSTSIVAMAIALLSYFIVSFVRTVLFM